MAWNDSDGNIVSCTTTDVNANNEKEISIPSKPETGSSFRAYLWNANNEPLCDLFEV